MSKVLAIVHLNGATTTSYDNLLVDLKEAKQLKLKARLHHFASIKEGEIQVVDIWESAADFQKIGEIMLPLAQKHGIDAQPKLYPLHNQLDQYKTSLKIK